VPLLYKAKTNGTLAHNFLQFSRCELATVSGLVPSGRDKCRQGNNCTFFDLSDIVRANPAARPQRESKDVPSVGRTGQ
jgi:hypothetical protein